MSRPQTAEQREQLQALVGGGAVPPRTLPPMAADAEDDEPAVQVGNEFVSWAAFWAMQEGAQ